MSHAPTSLEDAIKHIENQLNKLKHLKDVIDAGCKNNIHNITLDYCGDQFSGPLLMKDQNMYRMVVKERGKSILFTDNDLEIPDLYDMVIRLMPSYDDCAHDVIGKVPKSIIPNKR